MVLKITTTGDGWENKSYINLLALETFKVCRITQDSKYPGARDEFKIGDDYWPLQNSTFEVIKQGYAVTPFLQGLIDELKAVVK